MFLVLIQGNIDWDMVYSNNNTADIGWDIIEFNSGYVFTKNIDQGTIGSELVKIDLSANIIWSKLIFGINPNELFSLQSTNDGGLITTGRKLLNINSNIVESFINKTSNLGDTSWTRNFAGLGDAWGFSVEQTFDGGYIIAGVKILTLLEYIST